MIYLAAPYNDRNPQVVNDRMHLVETVLALLSRDGKHAFSPLLMHYVLDKGVDLPSGFEFWDSLCFDFLKRCDEMIILTLPGWDTSRGVQAEINFCVEHDIPFTYMHPEWIHQNMSDA